MILISVDEELSLNAERMATLFLKKRPDKDLGTSIHNCNGIGEDRKDLSEEKSSGTFTNSPGRKTGRPS